MTQVLNPYITFNGNAEQAMDFYAKALGGEVKSMTFRQAGMDVDGLMHSEVRTPEGFVIFASDFVEGMGEYNPGTNVQVSLSGDDTEALKGYWAKLSEGATVVMELAPQMWGDTYGQFVDQFGIIWHVNIAGQAA